MASGILLAAAVAASSDDLIVQNNFAASNGGAMAAVGGTTPFSGDFGIILFDSNTSSASYGGALYSGGSLTFTGVTVDGDFTISNNRATSSGGAFYSAGSTIIDVLTGGALVITGNTAGSGRGGALYGGQGVSISGVYGAGFNLSGNRASANGGAINSANGDITISATVARDLAIRDNAGTGGGAIYTDSKFIDITASAGGDFIITGNTASGNGGAFYANNASAGDITISATVGGLFSISGNTAGGAGGAIYAGHSIDITGSYAGITISGNTAGNSGAFGVNAGSMVLSALNSGTLEISRNNSTATILSSYNGGAFYASGSVVIGGTHAAIFITSNTNNTGYGGAFNAGRDIILSATATGDLDISRNYAGGYGNNAGGGAFNTTGGSLVLEGSYDNIRIDANNAAGVNGAAYLGMGGAFRANTITIDTLTAGTLAVTSNTAAGNGGAFYSGNFTLSGSYGDILLRDNANNPVSGNGAVIYSSDTLLISATVARDFIVASNTAGSNGAFWAAADAIINASAGGTLAFTGNTANAGAAFFVDGAVIITGGYGDMLFAGNTGNTGQGGAIRASTAITISATVAGMLAITDNYIGNNGGAFATTSGAIAISGAYGAIDITGNTTANNGGAIYAFGAGGITISTTVAGAFTIAGNTATAVSGGAFAAASGSIAITGSHGSIDITGNTAGRHGGALYAAGPSAISAATGTLTIASNTAGDLGGAIYSGSSFNLALADSATLSATNNKAANDASGGFLYVNSGSMLFDIGANATAGIGDTASVVNATDSIAAANGSINLHKEGRGTLALWANNTYTGTTFVNAGLLDLRGYVSSTLVTVATSATLAGTGTAGGNVVITAGGHLSPGNSAGLFTILGDLTLHDNARLDWDLGAPTGTSANPASNHNEQHTLGLNDLVRVEGDVTAGGVSIINITTSAPFTKGEYDLVNYGANLHGDAANFTIGTVSGAAAATPDELAKLKIVTSETNWIKLTYDLGNFYTYWDGGDTSGTDWNNGSINGSGGVWLAPGAATGTYAAGAYTAWTGSHGDAGYNGEWIQGGFAIFKGAPGTVTVVNSGTTTEFSGAQFRTDGYLLTGGTLTTTSTAPNNNIQTNIDETQFTTDPLAPVVYVTTTIATAITGTNGLDKTGGGTLVFAGTNTYEGPTSIIAGTLVMANANALGVNTATISADATLRVATGSMTFSNTVGGEGLFHVDLASSSGSFFLTPDSLSSFTGTALFNNSAYTLANDALANASVILGAGNTTTVATGTQRLGELAIDGGALVFTYATGTQAAGIIRTGALDAVGGTVTVANNNAASGTSGLFAKPLLQQDETASVRLIEASSVIGTNLSLAGGGTTSALIKNASLATTATATYTQTLNYAGGLSVDYALAQLALATSQTTILAGDTDAPGGADELHALITGAGHLQINATSAITLNRANTYTGNTTVATGTLITGTNNALGATNRLTLLDGAAVDMNGKNQSIGALFTNADSRFFMNGGTLTGTTATGWNISGLLDVTAAGSVINTGAANAGLVIGADGAGGRMFIASDAIVTSGNGLITNVTANASASVTISGNGLWNVTRGFYIASAEGSTGDITLRESGSLLGLQNAFVGYYRSSGSGTINIGDDALLAITGTLVIGESGTGALTMTGGSAVTGDALLGAKAGSAGAALVSGSAVWENTGLLALGGAGAATLAIAGDGTVRTGTLKIAEDSASAGSLALDGGLLQAGELSAGAGNARATFNSGTLRATRDGLLITGFTSGTSLQIATAANIDTNGWNVSSDSGFAGSGTLVKLGSGTLALSASSSYQGGTEIRDGAIVITHTAALGTGTAGIAAGALLRVETATDTTLGNALEGSGLLDIDLGGSARAFDFGTATAASTGARYTGTVRLSAATINLGTAARHDGNAAALAGAYLQILDGSVLASNSETRRIGGLYMGANSVTVLDMNGVVPAQVLQTGTLAVDSAARIAFGGYTDSPAPVISATSPKNFLEQDDPTANAVLLIAADTLLTPGVLIDVTRQDGVTPLDGGQKIDYGNVIATYGHAGIAVSASTAYSALASNTAGLYYDYVLTVLDIKTGTALTLDSTAAADSTLGALITGAGNLELIAGAGAITLSHSNSYTGATTITSGTVIAAADDALGHTSSLSYGPNGSYDLNGHTQAIGSGSIGGALLGTGSLGLAGLVDITSANAAFAANAGVTGTTTLRNTQALGDTGAVAIAGNAELSLRSASGTFFKQIAGSGLFSLADTATVALAGANTAFTGAFAIGPGSRLQAETNAHLGGAGGANLSGSGVFEKQNAATTITIDHANTAFTGTTLVTGGTLVLSHLQGAGSGAIVNNATLELAASGAFSNTTSGNGLTRVTGDLAITGNNAAFTGTLAIAATGTATVTGNDNIGALTAHVDIAAGGKLVTSATTFTNSLTGAGTLYVDTVGRAFNLLPGSYGLHPSEYFLGTLELHNSAYNLSADNAIALTRATLLIDTGADVAAGAGAQQTGNLTLASGTLTFVLADTGDTARGIIRTGILDVRDTVIVIDTSALPESMLPILQQDENHDITLVESTTLAAGSKPLITGAQLVDHLGNQITNATTLGINQSGETVANSTYDFAATASDTGLVLGYSLVALDLLDGKTTTLDQDVDNAILQGADELHAKITGSGDLRIDAAGRITLDNPGNTYTGATLVAGGTLRLANDNSLGATRLLDLAAGTILDVNGRTQAIGSVNTAASSTLSLNGGSLIIANGGDISGNLDSGGDTASLRLAGGTTSIRAANPNYAAPTAIDAPATARLADAAALGHAAIALDGALVLDTAASGTMRNTLAGDGSFAKLNTGTVAIATSSPGYHGPAAINQGRVVAQHIHSLGDAEITIAPGSAFEMSGVSGTLANTLKGAGSFDLAGSQILVDRANAIASTLTVNLNPASALWLGAGNIALGVLNMNAGTLAFDSSVPTAAAGITTLGGGAGSFLLNVKLASMREGINPAGTIANYLDIAGAGGAAHTVYLNVLSAPPVVQNASVELINVTAPGDVNFVMGNPGGKLEYDLSAFELLRGDGSQYTPGTNKWYLADRGLSHAADAIIQTAASLALDWAYSLDSLHLRMGEVRAENPASPDNPKSETPNPQSGNLWVRTRGYRLNAAGAVTGFPYRQYGWGVTAGADKTFATEKGANLLGGFIDIGNVSRQFDNNGDGSTGTVGMGAYLTLLRNDGWFADLVGRLDRHGNNFNARAYDGSATRGNYSVKSLGLSAEAGRRIRRADGWWLEPALQIAALWLDGSDYSTRPAPAQRAIEVRQDDSATYQYRALVRFGRQFKDSKWHPYGKLAAVSVESDSGEIHSRGKSLDATYDGKRIEFGFGTMYRINDTSQAYLDYEYAKAANYERPWSLNLGYRRLW